MPSSRLAFASALAAAAIAFSPAVAEPASAAHGEALFRANCSYCHTTGATEAHGMGPNLHGVVGRKPASAPGFDYTASLKRLGQPWTAASLDPFLAAPEKVAPGTQMPVSTPNPQNRADLIAYLQSLK